MGIDALQEVVDELVKDPSGLGQGEDLVALLRQQERIGAVVALATAAFDASEEYARDGAQTAAAWIATQRHLPPREARRQVRLGRALHKLPHCQKAWLEGDINGAQVDVMAKLYRKETKDALERDEERLVDHATGNCFGPFTRIAGYWEQLADPDGTDEKDEQRRTRRDVYLTSGFDGMWFGGMTLDPISGAIVSEELTRIEHQLFEADWAEAKAALGREPTVFDLARTASQRRADALVEMATRSKSLPPGSRRPDPLFTVVVGWETMHGRICELAQGTVVSPGSLLRWLDPAYLERVVFAPGVRAEVSPTARLFTGATRRAIEVRDRECTHPYCDRPAFDCQADHIQPYTDGGPTTQENGRMRCPFHNRLRNQRPPPDD